MTSPAYVRHPGKGLFFVHIHNQFKNLVPLSFPGDLQEADRLQIVFLGMGEVEISELVKKNFDLTPSGIINSLGLLSPIYAHTAYHGHFGRTPNECCEGAFSWEKTDKVDVLRQPCNCSAATS